VRSVDQEGTTVLGSTGQVRVHPAFGELRQYRLALGRLLAQLNLPDVDETSLRTPSWAGPGSEGRTELSPQMWCTGWALCSVS